MFGLDAISDRMFESIIGMIWLQVSRVFINVCWLLFFTPPTLNQPGSSIAALTVIVGDPSYGILHHRIIKNIF